MRIFTPYLFFQCVFNNFQCVITLLRALSVALIVATIRGDFCFLKSSLVGINTTVHRYRPNNIYRCVLNTKRRIYPYLLVDFYDTSHFEMINFANVKIEHFNSDPLISLFGNMQITSIHGK